MIRIGEIEVTPLSDGKMRLDGGAMFGVVPRALWEGANPVDAENRVLLALRPLLIRAGGELIIVDPGVGEKGDDKFKKIFAIERPPTLPGSLEDLSLAPDDITMVINTHLHFDHAGGNTVKGPDGRLRPVFGKARYIVQNGELDAAMNPNERTRASYRAEDFVPVLEANLFDPVDGDAEVAPGVSVFRTSGHNRDIQLVRVESGGETAVFLSDIIPTAGHLRYPYIAGYDLYPLDTLKVKKDILTRAAAGGWLLFFYHDPDLSSARVRMEDDGDGKGARPVLEKVS